MKTAYETGSLEKIGGLVRSQYQVIRMCEYYSDSKYLGSYIGNKKKIGRGVIDVPFNNVVNFRVALAKTATDLDIKDVQIEADDPEYQVESMILNRECYQWMKKSGFSKTLNQMGSTRPKYGGYLVKKNETDGLKIDVVRWTNVWTDQNDVLAGPIVETHQMSPVALKKKDGTWYNIDDVLQLHKKIKAKERPSTIEVREVTGEYPIAVFKDANDEERTDADNYTFSLQRYYCAHVGGLDVIMYSEELDGEMTDYYEYLTWEDNGYGLGRGVIEDSEEAQVWTNNAVIEESLAMKLAGRVGIKTTSKKIGGSILEHDHGKIYNLEQGADMNAFNMAPGALGQYQNIIDRWKMQADNVTSSYNATTGEQPPAGTPYSQTALLNQVATKPFDYKREEWGIHLTKLFEKWVIPYLIDKIKKEHILVSDWSETELDAIDQSFANQNTNQGLVKMVLAHEKPTTDMQSAMTQGYRAHIKKLGKKRFLLVPDNYFDGIVPKVTVLTTGEQKNKGVILQSLSEILKTVIASYNPQNGTFGVLEDPTLKRIFDEIVEISGSGISAIALGGGSGKTQQNTAAQLSTPPLPQAPIPTTLNSSPALTGAAPVK